MEFEIVSTRIGDEIYRVEPRGELDLATASELTAQLTTAVEHGARFILLDLAALIFLDSTGLAVIWQMHQRLDASGGRLTLANPQPAVSRVFEVTGVTERIYMARSETEALAHLRELAAAVKTGLSAS